MTVSIFLRGIKGRALKALVAILLLSSLLLTQGCAERKDAYSAMRSFAASIAFGGEIYSPSLPEYETGFVGEGLLSELFGGGEELVEDYAVIFPSGAVVGECALFVCRSEYAALEALDLCALRLDFLERSSNYLDASSLKDAFVLKSGRCVLICAMPDNARAKEIWQRIL